MDDPLNNDNDLTPEFPIDEGPIPFEPDLSDTGLSRKPLNLGSGGGLKSPTSRPAPVPAPPKIKPQKTIVSTDRITRIKTFHTKLMPNAMAFLDEVICEWLAKNPSVVVHKVNVVTGTIEAKRHDPSLIITIWY